MAFFPLTISARRRRSITSLYDNQSSFGLLDFLGVTTNLVPGHFAQMEFAPNSAAWGKRRAKRPFSAVLLPPWPVWPHPISTHATRSILPPEARSVITATKGCRGRNYLGSFYCAPKSRLRSIRQAPAVVPGPKRLFRLGAPTWTTSPSSSGRPTMLSRLWKFRRAATGSAWCFVIGTFYSGAIISALTLAGCGLFGLNDRNSETQFALVRQID